MKQLLLSVFFFALALSISWPTKAQTHQGNPRLFTGATSIMVETPDSVEQACERLTRSLEQAGYTVLKQSIDNAPILGAIRMLPVTSTTQLMLTFTFEHHGAATFIIAQGRYVAAGESKPLLVSNLQNPGSEMAAAWKALQAAATYPGGNLWYRNDTPVQKHH